MDYSEDTKAKQLQFCMAKFSHYLQKNGHKITEQRTFLASRIFCTSAHFTVEQLVDDIHREKGTRISRATVYRVITILLEANLINEHDFGGPSKYYEHNCNQSHHDHLICSNCGYIIEFCDSKIEMLQEKVAYNLGFRLKQHFLNLYADCKKLEETGHCPHKAHKDRKQTLL